MNNLKIEIKETGKYGKGVFAKEFIKKGDVIYVLGGKKINTKEFVELVNSDMENIDDPLQIGKRTYLDLDKTSRCFNHRCDPNGGMRKNSELFAIKGIQKGEEINFDYSTTIAPTEWKMKCGCGASNCRKIIGDITSVPKKQINYYLKNAAIQRYMKLVLKQIEKGQYVMPNYEIELLKKLKLKHN